MNNTLDQLEKELYKLNPSPKDPQCWVTRDHRIILIAALDDRHLLNILLKIKRSFVSIFRETPIDWRTLLPDSWKDRVKNLEEEILKRGYIDWESRRPNQVKPKKHFTKA